MGWIADTGIIIFLVLFIWSGALSGFVDGFVRILTVIIAFVMVIYGAEFAVQEFGVPTGFTEDIAISLAATILVMLTFFIGILLRKALHTPNKAHASILGAFIGFGRGYLLIICLVLVSAFLPPNWIKPLWDTSLTLPSIGYTTNNLLSLVPLPDNNIGNYLARLRFTDNDSRPYIAENVPTARSTEPQPELTADDQEQAGVVDDIEKELTEFTE